MKKALQSQRQVFLSEKDGNLSPEEVCVEEVLAAVNRGMAGEWPDVDPRTRVLKLLHGWICRYLEEGATDSFLNDLNGELHQVQYYNYVVVPSGLFEGGGDEPVSAFVSNMNLHYSLEAFAAKEFARFVTYGMLRKVRRCQYPGCASIFLGPPQAKWCSKTCGSKYRVEKKRKLDSQ